MIGENNTIQTKSHLASSIGCDRNSVGYWWVVAAWSKIPMVELGGR